MVYVSSRPGLKIFLKHVSDLFEVVIYTASMKEVKLIIIVNLFLVCRSFIRYNRSSWFYNKKIF